MIDLVRYIKRKEDNIMNKELTKTICKIICKTGEKIAEREVNTTCALITYQEIIPQEVLRLKKNER